MEEQQMDTRGILWGVLVFVVVYGLVRLGGYLGVHEEPVRAVPGEERATTGESDMADAILGSNDETLAEQSFEYVGTRGTEWTFPDNVPVTSYAYDEMTGSPPDPVSWAEEDPGVLYTLYVTYDPETLVLQTGYAYGIGGEGSDFRIVVYTPSGNLVAQSQRITDPEAGTGWFSAPMEGDVSLDPDEDAYVVGFWTTGGFWFYSSLVPVPPVSLSETVSVNEALRLGVRFGEEVTVTERMRPGVFLGGNVSVAEQIRTHLKTSPRTGLCTGHNVSDEDAGGSYE